MHSPCAGADALARGARAVESDDIEQSVKMLLEALELYENDGKEALGADTYRLTIATMIKGGSCGRVRLARHQGKVGGRHVPINHCHHDQGWVRSCGRRELRNGGEHMNWLSTATMIKEGGVG